MTKRGNRYQHIGDDQLVYGMPKHMEASLPLGADTSKQGKGSSGDEPVKTEKRTFYTLRAKDGACDLCSSLDGIRSEEIPTTHPNCKCSIEEEVVEVPVKDEKNDQKKAEDLLGKKPATPEEIDEWFEAMARIDISALEEKTLNEVVKRMQEYENDPGIFPKLGVGAARKITGLIKSGRRRLGVEEPKIGWSSGPRG